MAHTRGHPTVVVWPVRGSLLQEGLPVGPKTYLAPPGPRLSPDLRPWPRQLLPYFTLGDPSGLGGHPPHPRPLFWRVCRGLHRPSEEVTSERAAFH